MSAQKVLPAVKTLQAPVIDGRLDDAAWQSAPLASDFVQSFPSFGNAATSSTEVRLLYDNNAVYISARLYDRPENIRRQLTARDGERRQDVDYFAVFFDTYNDQQNGFLFLVTTANVQTDVKLNANATYSFGEFGDRTWDAVWQSSVKTANDGWTVEMRIPYISLRFAKKDVQTWGLQLLRFSRRNNEYAYWNPVNPNQNGFINQFGKYTPLTNIEPPLRLSLSPYVSGGYRQNPAGSYKTSEWLRNGGMDVKYGLNESFTLDATLVPDFGQVISDNVVNNLSPFEIKFQENRPFFTEGTELFNKAGLFYSRRIGAQPSGYAGIDAVAGNTYTVMQNPSVTRLYNGVKFSGRTKNKLGIGVFNALTAPMQARLTNKISGRDSLVQTEPLTNYNIVVLDQALRGRSSLTFTNTSVLRSGEARDANVSALDASLYSSDNRFRLRTQFRYSHIFGYTPYKGSINLVDDTITRNGTTYVKPYDGFNSLVQFAKVSGKVQYSLSNTIFSNGYDPNDLGFLLSPNEVSYSGTLSYNQLTPTKTFINYTYTATVHYQYLYKPYAYNQFELNGRGSWILKNFWDFNIGIGAQPFAQNDYFELRTPGRYLQRPSFYYLTAGGSTDSRKKLYTGTQLSYAYTNVEDGAYYETSSQMRYRFSNRFSLSLDVNTEHDETQIGYAFQREANGEPIIGYRRYLQTDNILSGIYNFTPRLNLTLRARHYWNEVTYKSFYNVAADGTHRRRAFIPGQDENYNLFNVDGFLTWDFGLGSRIIAGYKNWVGDPYSVSGPRNYFRNLNGLFRTSHGNEVTLKLIYFLDYNSLRRKH